MAVPQVQNTLQVCESLLKEHRLMETLLSSFESKIKQFPSEPNEEIIQDISTLLITINHELNVHFACEEEALFPAVSSSHPMVLMEVEHEEIITLWNTLRKQFEARQFSEFQESSTQFIDYLQGHIGREDAGIFPTCEQALAIDKKQDVIAQMEQIREKSKLEIIPPISRPEKRCQKIAMDLGTISDKPLMIKLLAESSKRQIKHLTIRANESLPSHWSPKELLIFCVSGQATFISQEDGEEILLEPGSGVVLGPQYSHAIHAKSDCHFLMTVA